MLSVLFLTDTHIRAYSPVSRCDNFQETVFAKLAEVVQLAREHAVDLVLHGGDVFDIPQVSHRLTGRTAELFRSFPCPVWVVPGNHDLFGSISTIEYTSLGVLARAGVVKLLTEDTDFVANGISLCIHPIPASGEIPASAYMFPVPVPRGQYHIIVTHDNLVLNPIHPDIPHKVISPELSNADLVLAGHWHPGWPDVVKSGRTLYVNPGSLARVSIEKLSKDRQVRAALLTISDGGMFVDFLPIEAARPFSEVFTGDHPQGGRAVSAPVLSEFAAGLSGAIVDVFTLLEQSDADEDVKKLITDTAAAIPGRKVTDVSCVHESLRLVKLVVSGFQSHKNTTVKFSPGLNVIVGPNGSGKSALLRALWWLYYDEPKGTRLMNVDSDVQRVGAVFSSGAELSRKRTKASAGSYEVKKPGQDPVVLTGVGNRLPPEVIDVHKTPQVDLVSEGVVLNIARQFDSPFLVGHTNGTNIALLDNLTNNDIASSVLKQLRSAADTLKRKLAICVPQYERLEQLASVVNQIAALSKPLSCLYKDYDYCIERFKLLASACDLAERWSKLQATAGTLISTWDECALEARLVEAGEFINTTEAALVSYQSDILPFLTSYNTEVSSYQAALSNLNLSGFAESYSRYRHMLASTTTCPLCGGEFDCSEEVVVLDSDYDSLSRNLESVCSLEVQPLIPMDDTIVTNLRRVKQEYEFHRSGVAALAKVLEIHRNNILALRQECLSVFGVEPEELSAKVAALAQELHNSVDLIARSLASIECDYKQLAEQAGMSI